MTRHTIICPDLSDFSTAVSEPVSLYDSLEIPTFEKTQIELFRALWDEIHTKQNPTREWFETWRAKVPNFSGCGCGDFLRDYCIANPPRFKDFPRWSWELHNAVNAKLERGLFSWSKFLCRYPIQQPPISDFVAVTSLAPHRFDRQTEVLNSWVKFGLKIVSVNTFAEFEAIGSDYPQVSAWMHSESDCKTQRINSLLDVATRWELPVLLINSDIEIYGDQSRLISLARARKSAIGIRFNYDSSPLDSTSERWGLDAYLVYPEQVARLPRVDWAIGKPMWDYWLAWELNRLGGSPEWIGDPYFFHKSHPVAWTQEECTKSHLVFNEQFEPMDWAAWRAGQPFWIA